LEEGVTPYLEVGDRDASDEVRYPDIDLVLTTGPAGRVFCHNDGRPGVDTVFGLCGDAGGFSR
jgi:uncharacterized cupin superfamily protein